MPRYAVCGKRKRIMDRHRILFIVTILLLTAFGQTVAQETDVSRVPGWYAGVEAGVPFGVSTFSSFGADKPRAGFAAGVFGGYRFNPVLSAELSVKWGKTTLSAQDCCIASGYWLGCDGQHYLAPVAGMDGHLYKDLKSGVSLQSYGVRLNINLLGLFGRTRRSRWTLEVSPLLAMTGTEATVRTISTDERVSKDGTEWHLGVGGSLQASYRLTERLSVGLYSGITYLTGSRMDGMPGQVHRNNYIWESGIRLGWSFGGKQRKATSTAIVPKEPPAPHEVCLERQEPVQEMRPECSDTVAVLHTDTIVPPRDTVSCIEKVPANKVETAVIAVETEEETRLTFPAVYFAFNRTDIAAGETAKLESIRRTLEEHPDVRVLVTGWCDNRGSRTVNDRISRMRAEAVKAWLVRCGIPATRIITLGKGIDHAEPDRCKARRAEIHRQGKEELK